MPVWENALSPSNVRNVRSRNFCVINMNKNASIRLKIHGAWPRCFIFIFAYAIAVKMKLKITPLRYDFYLIPSLQFDCFFKVFTMDNTIYSPGGYFGIRWEGYDTRHYTDLIASHCDPVVDS